MFDFAGRDEADTERSDVSGGRTWGNVRARERKKYKQFSLRVLEINKKFIHSLLFYGETVSIILSRCFPDESTIHHRYSQRNMTWRCDVNKLRVWMVVTGGKNWLSCGRWTIHIVRCSPSQAVYANLLFPFRHAVRLCLEFDILLIYHLFVARERFGWSDVDLRKLRMSLSCRNSSESFVACRLLLTESSVNQVFHWRCWPSSLRNLNEDEKKLFHSLNN